MSLEITALSQTECICGHAEDEHFKYGANLTRGRCKLDGVSNHYCLNFESVAAEAQRQREQEERRERMKRLTFWLGHFTSDQIEGDTLRFEFESHRYEIREIE